MKIEYKGAFILISFEENELQDSHVPLQLADGYSYERIFINAVSNVTDIVNHIPIIRGDRITLYSLPSDQFK